MNAVHVTVSGVLVRRNNSRQDSFIEAAEPAGLISEWDSLNGISLSLVF